jgi:serine/threonine protein kinase
VYIDSGVLGEGAYATVYRVAKTYSADKYAMKKIIIQSSEADVGAQNEIRYLKMFTHAHVIPLLDHQYGVANGSKVAYLLFPLMPGGSLRDVINAILEERRRPFMLHQILKDFLDVLGAFNTLHSSDPSYVHADIKPENILLDARGTCYLADFGSVREARVEIKTRNDVRKPMSGENAS